MSKDTQIVSVQATPAMAEYVEYEGGTGGGGPNPVLVAKALLRNRVKLSVFLAILFAGAFAAGAWSVIPPKYESKGLVRIKPYIRPILPTGDQNGVLPQFDSYVEAQAQLLQVQRTIEYAMQLPQWQKLGRGSSSDAEAKFTDSLSVTHEKGSQDIEVKFADKNPDAAMTGVQTLLTAYQSLYGEGDEDSPAKMIPALEDRQRALNDQIKSLQERIVAIAIQYGSDTLDRAYQYKLDQANQLETQLKIAQVEVARTASSAATQPSETNEEIVVSEAPLLERDLADRELIQRELDGAQSRLGAAHPHVKQLNAQLTAINKRIEDRTAKVRDAVGMQTTGIGNSLIVQSPQQLKSRVAALQTLFDAANAEMLEVGKKNVQIQNLRKEQDNARQTLDEIKKRIEGLNFDVASTGRVKVLSFGDRPLAPLSKNKRIAATAGGGMLGAMFGVALAMLFGFMDRRLQSVADTQPVQGPREKILGVLPVLPKDLSDPEEAATAAYCVHHIRALLQIGRRVSGQRVFAVTSPAAGDGKTSLAIALGLSFAACGSKTLLVDCDLVGGGLSSRMAKISRRKIGRILMREGLINEEQLREALKISRQSKRKVGEVLVELGYLSEADVQHALGVQNDSTVGLRDVLAGERVDDGITGTGIPSLFILPLGGAHAGHVGQLSPVAIRRIIDSARKDYDTILFDTGPVLGSIEASIVAAEVDRVVMVISRGEQRPLAERAIEHVKSVGGQLAGVVFNRARLDDVISSGYSSYSQRSQPAKLLAEKHGDSHQPKLGPMGVAVASSTVAKPGKQLPLKKN
jgi:Mrp family chromosome partitioning ATPase/uncharacterized protein involved in exopolysaccharide biosynthesis